MCWQCDFVILEKEDGKKSYELSGCIKSYHDNDILNEDQMDMWEVWYCETAISFFSKQYNKHKDQCVNFYFYDEQEIESDIK